MSDNLNLERYQQTPQAFRKKTKDYFRKKWDWLFDKPGEDSPKGGELGKVVKISIKQINSARTNSPPIQRAIKVLNSRVARRILGLLLVSCLTVWIKNDADNKQESQKQDAQRPILEVVFDNLESIALGSAGIIFLLETSDRRKKDHYEAWQVINSAMGQTGSGSRIQALEDLATDDVSLEGVAAPKADLSNINLSSANLARANLAHAQLDGANLRGANLRGANLYRADLRGAYLMKANLIKANLAEANLTSAHMEGAHLEESNLCNAELKETYLNHAYLTKAHLLQANLQKASLQAAYLMQTNCHWADLRGADLKYAILKNANFQWAILIRTNLKNANLTGVNLKEAYLSETHLEGAELQNVTNLKVHQLRNAYLCDTNLPDDVDLNPRRNY